MTKREIELCGKSYLLAFDFATYCEIEGQTGRQPDFTDTSVSNLTLILWCAIKTHNDDCPTLLQFRQSLTLDSFKSLNEALSPLIAEFYDIPSVAESHVAQSDNAPDQKNV